MPPSDPQVTAADATYTTIEAAKVLGMAVRSVQLMADRGELEAWKTSGGHRRISRESVHRWLESRGGPTPQMPPTAPSPPQPSSAPQKAGAAQRVLLIEDSTHYQNLLRLLLAQRFPQVELHVAADGIAGLAMAGRLEPDVLIVDILLPGIDGATLITGLRSHDAFRKTKLLVITSLDADQRGPYAFALEGIPVVHKPQIVTALPALLEAALAQAREEAGEGVGGRSGAR
ncbi:MAG: excisionase family DNA-binding protein [Pseudomonadota bacterium]